jgi:hypothetical protein
MALTEWQAQLGSLVVGADTDYIFDGPITGLGVPAPRTSDLDLPTGGTVGGRDLPARRSIGLEVAIVGEDAAAVMDSVAALNAAWAPTSTDTYLDICLPGMGTVRWTGRPRGADLDLTDLHTGAARARLLFDALDPDGEPEGS